MHHIQLLDVVVLNESLPDQNLQRGSIGTVVEVLENDDFLVEFADLKGVAYAMVELPASFLIKVYSEPVSA